MPSTARVVPILRSVYATTGYSSPEGAWESRVLSMLARSALAPRIPCSAPWDADIIACSPAMVLDAPGGSGSLGMGGTVGGGGVGGDAAVCSDSAEALPGASTNT